MVNAIFFDRDGVLTKLVHRDIGNTAPWRPEEFVILPRVAEAVALTRPYFRQFVVTNQPDVLDGNLQLTDLHQFHDTLITHGGFDEIVYCLERGSTSYKPNTGMVEYLVEKYDVDVTQSFMIGDRWKDIACGCNTGLATIFIGDKYEDGGSGIYPDFFAADVFDACQLIMEQIS